MADNTKKGKYKPSSGKRKGRVAKRAARKLRMKIVRWKRYQEEISINKRASKASRWNTDGLEQHVKFLQKIA